MIQPLLIPTAAEKRIDTDFYVEGYATTFDKPYLLYEWDGNKYYERIDRNALAGADMSDVIMQYNHEGKVLARLSNGTLGVEANDNGLFTFADLSKSRAAQDMFEEIKNGLVTKMSWAFRVSEDSYDRDTRTRTILKIAKVYDVSAVSIPANADTDISARSYFDGVIEREQQERLERRKKLLKIKLMQKAQQEEIKTRFNSRRSTGALLASIKVSAVKEIDGGKRVEIYPNGKDKHGVRNAEKGFVLNYGRSNMPARPWFTAANEKAADDVVSEMRRVWEEKQNEER